MNRPTQTDRPSSLRVLFREDADHNVQTAPQQRKCSTFREARDAGEDWLDDVEVEDVRVKLVEDDNVVFLNAKSQQYMNVWIDEDDINAWAG